VVERTPRRSGFRRFILARRNLRPVDPRIIHIYDGRGLRKLRAERGVGRPPRRG
jgi:hypothetical protein